VGLAGERERERIWIEEENKKLQLFVFTFICLIGCNLLSLSLSCLYDFSSLLLVDYHGYCFYRNYF
jgi:hypothetical protein